MNLVQREQIDQIVYDIMQLSRNTLVMHLRFLDAAIFQLQLEMGGTETIATNGKALYFAPRHIIQTYRENKQQVVRDFIHCIFHCIFQHPYIPTLLNQTCWDLACDIAVENMITELNLKILESPREQQQSSEIQNLKRHINFLTAEKIYRYYLDSGKSETELQKIHKVFQADDHAGWYEMTDRDGNGDGDGDGSGSNESNSYADVREQWENISKRVQVDLETISKERGDTAGAFTQNLTAVHREKYDYASFLKRFSVLGESMVVNDDEFDYVFYTYGLQLYKRVPLIEPLEYKEVKRVKEFVIAIDTSGSCSGELVEKFITKTYNMLKQGENFFERVNIHIVQCDAEIQDVTKITNQKEFETYMNNLQLRGFGGTDFRPVFQYVDEQIRLKEFTNLKGLIYFTDGYGEFPAKKPKYHAAFVFLDDDYGQPEVPNWAIKLVLRTDDI